MAAPGFPAGNQATPDMAAIHKICMSKQRMAVTPGSANALQKTVYEPYNASHKTLLQNCLRPLRCEATYWRVGYCFCNVCVFASFLGFCILNELT